MEDLAKTNSFCLSCSAECQWFSDADARVVGTQGGSGWQCADRGKFAVTWFGDAGGDSGGRGPAGGNGRWLERHPPLRVTDRCLRLVLGESQNAAHSAAVGSSRRASRDRVTAGITMSTDHNGG